MEKAPPAKDMQELSKEKPESFVPDKQRTLKAAKKAEPKPGGTNMANFVTKQHKRGGGTAFAIFDKSSKKQVGQLLDTVVHDADVKVDNLVKQLNAGSVTKEAAVQILNQWKQQAS